MSTLSADDRASLLEFLAAEMGGQIEPDLMVPAECSLSRGVLVLAGEQCMFASQRFGRWELQERFPLSAASQVEAGPAFSGGGYQLRLLVGGKMLRFGELDEGMARAVVRAMGASTGASMKAAGPSLAPRRPAASLASTHMPTSPHFAGLAAGGASVVREHGAIGVGFVDTSRAASWAADHPVHDEDAAHEGDDEDSDEHEELDDAELRALMSKAEGRQLEAAMKEAAGRATGKATATKQAPKGSIGSVLARAVVAGMLTAVISLAWSELHLPPFDGDHYPPPFYSIVYWLAVAWGGALACGSPGRIFSVSFWAMFAGIASWIVGAEAHQFELAALFGTILLGFGYMRARSAEAAFFKAFAVGLAISIVNQWGVGVSGELGLSFSITIFWLLHFLWERADSGKVAKPA